MSCTLGHTQRAYECPACGEAATGQVATLEHWRWYRGRTSSKRVKARIDEHLAAVIYRPCPRCGLSAVDTLLSADIRRDTAVFECPCGCVYALHFTRGGLLLDTRVVE